MFDALGPELTSVETWARKSATFPNSPLSNRFRSQPRVSKWLHYLPVYQGVLASLPDQPVRMLEIGVDRGGSLQVWADYLKEGSVVVGVDINPECARFDAPDLNQHVRIGDQSDPKFLARVGDEFGPFNLILDDGSHRSSDLISTFRQLFDSRLAAGGVYVAEDLHASFLSPYVDSRLTFLDVAYGIADLLHAQYVVESDLSWYDIDADGMPSSYPPFRELQVPRITKLVASVEIFDSMVIIRKSSGDRDLPASFSNP